MEHETDKITNKDLLEANIATLRTTTSMIKNRTNKVCVNWYMTHTNNRQAQATTVT